VPESVSSEETTGNVQALRNCKAAIAHRTDSSGVLPYQLAQSAGRESGPNSEREKAAACAATLAAGESNFTDRLNQSGSY
jgi:hypothetical protein